MAREYRAGLLFTGNADGAVKAAQATEKEINRLNSAQKRGQESTKSYASSWSGLGGVMRGLIPVITAASFISLTTQTLQAADSIQKLSIRLGASTEALSEYRHVAELTGVTNQALTTGWQRQTRRIAEAAAGTGEAKKALEELNLSAQYLKQLRPEQQFEILADAMQGVKTEADRVRLAMKLWDSDGVSLLQTIDGGSESIRRMREEARMLGKSLSREQVDAAAAANDAITRLSAAYSGLADTLVLKVAKPLEWVANRLSRWVGEDVNQKAERLSRTIDELRANLAGPSKSRILDFFTSDAQIEKWREELKKAEADFDALQQSIWSSGIEEIPSVGAIEKVGEYEKTVEKTGETVKKTGEKVKDTTDYMELMLEEYIAQEEAVIAAYDAEENYISGLQEELDLLQYTGKELAVQTELRKAHAQGIMDQDQAIRSLVGQIYDAQQATRAHAEEAGPYAELWTNALKRIDEAFADVWQGAFDSFDSFKNSLLGAFKQLLGELAHQAITKPIVLGFASAMGFSGQSSAASSLMGGVSGSGGADGGMMSNLGMLSSGYSMLGSNSFGMGLMSAGDMISPGLLADAGMISNLQYGITGLVAGLIGDQLFGGYGGAGASIGATVGTAFGPVGTVVGGLLGGAIGGMFGGDKKQKTRFASSVNMHNWEDNAYGQSAFGYFGMTDAGSKNVDAGKFQEAFDGLAAIDNQIAQTFGPEATERVRKAVETMGYRGSFDNFVKDRLDIIIKNLGVGYSDLVLQGTSYDDKVARLGAFKGIQDFVDSSSVADFETLSAANQTLYDVYKSQTVAINEQIRTWDKSTESTQQLMAATQQRYALELQMLGQIQASQDAIRTSLAGSIEAIKQSLMAEDERYNYLTDKAENLAAAIDTMSDPQKIEQTVAEIQSLTNQAYSLLSGEQQQIVGQEFIDFFEGLQTKVDQRLDAARADLVSDSDGIRVAIERAMDTASERFRVPAFAMQAAAEIFRRATASFQSSLPIAIKVSYPTSGEVG